jgi:hypothetical protein
LTPFTGRFFGLKVLPIPPLREPEPEFAGVKRIFPGHGRARQTVRLSDSFIPTPLRYVEPISESLAVRTRTFVLAEEVDDRQIVVKVLAEGFEFESRHYRSLSAIAREVTGADAQIEWEVQLANRKAAARKLGGGGRRNQGKKESDLIIDTGPQRISGVSQAMKKLAGPKWVEVTPPS